MKIRRSGERGSAEHGWLHSKHTFSFAEYYDKDQMGYRTLRVINDDVIEPGEGFGTHGHRDMEIISVIVEGELAHKDSLGHVETITPGEVQVMSAGRGIEHSEYNPSKTDRTHLLQIWIMPERKGLPSSYGQKRFPLEDNPNQFVRIAGPKRELDDGALPIHQDADVHIIRLEPGGTISYSLKKHRGAWVHIIKGTAHVNNEMLYGGDAASIEGEAAIVLKGVGGGAELLLFDLR